jgi:SAM-dependent methyltransferase
MHRVDYDRVAPVFEQRYQRSHWRDVGAVVQDFLRGCQRGAIAEIGCGTGHWLEIAAEGERVILGLDRSWRMLDRARGPGSPALFVQGAAEALPWAGASLERIFCVNALHHFVDPAGFIEECRRVLRPGGGFLTIALDPHTGTDRWWIYDYFPAALEADLERYPSTTRIRDLLSGAGFTNIATTVAQHIPAAVSYEHALESGILDRRSTSQLMVISDESFDAGMERLRSERPTLEADLRLFATVGWRDAGFEQLEQLNTGERPTLYWV